MIVASVGAWPVDWAAYGVEGIDAVELRLDLLGVPPAGLAEIMDQTRAATSRIIVTCRPGLMPEAARTALLLEGIRLGAYGVDVEVDALPASRRAVVEAARAAGCIVIVSHHDYERTPSRDVLLAIVDAASALGADIVKIACRVAARSDNATLLGLLDRDGRGARLAVLGMGREAWLTRVVGPLLGSELAYVAVGRGLETADGQPTAGELRRAWSAIRDDRSGRGA